MANLGKKDGIYCIRFRYRGTEYKRSLKTRDEGDAQAARRWVEQTIHLITIGRLHVPDGVDPGDFIAAGGKIPESRQNGNLAPTLRKAIEEYTESLGRLAPSTRSTVGIHLGNLKKRH